MDGTTLGSTQTQLLHSTPAGGKAAGINGSQQPVTIKPGVSAASPLQQQQLPQQLVEPPSSLAGRPAVSKPYADVAPEIHDLISTMLGIYSAQSHDDLSRVFERFKSFAEFDLPFFFVRGADRMRVLTNMLHITCDKVEADPRLVSVQMLDNQLGCIAVEGTVTFFPRLRHVPLLGHLVASGIPLHVTWEIIATGDDDKILRVKETMHNLPEPPQLLRGVWGTALTTLGLPFSSW